MFCLQLLVDETTIIKKTDVPMQRVFLSSKARTKISNNAYIEAQLICHGVQIVTASKYPYHLAFIGTEVQIYDKLSCYYGIRDVNSH
jgi:hypothetical protein